MNNKRYDGKYTTSNKVTKVGSDALATLHQKFSTNPVQKVCVRLPLRTTETSNGGLPNHQAWHIDIQTVDGIASDSRFAVEKHSLILNTPALALPSRNDSFH